MSISGSLSAPRTAKSSMSKRCVAAGLGCAGLAATVCADGPFAPAGAFPACAEAGIDAARLPASATPAAFRQSNGLHAGRISAILVTPSTLHERSLAS